MKTHLSSKDANSLWNLLAIPVATFSIWFWVDISQPDEESSLPFMANFLENEVFIIALPTSAILASILAMIAVWHCRALCRENGSGGGRISDYLPTIPKMELGGREGALVRWVFFLGITFGPLALMLQSFRDMMKSSVYHEGTKIADGNLDLFLIPWGYFREAVGGGPALRFLDPVNGKEAFAPFQIWIYTILMLVALFFVARLFYHLRKACKVVEKKAVEEVDEISDNSPEGKKSTVVALVGALLFFSAPGFAEEKELSPGLRIEASETFMESILKKELPNELLLSESNKLPNMGIWWNLRAENLVAVPKKDSLSLQFREPDLVEVVMSADLKGDFKYDYKHEWIEMETVSKWGIKFDVPKHRAETRTRKGQVSSAVAVTAVFRVSLVSDNNGTSLSLVGLPAQSKVSMDKIKIEGVNKALEAVSELLANRITPQKVESAFIDEISKTQTLALNQHVPAAIFENLRDVSLEIENGKLSLSAH